MDIAVIFFVIGVLIILLAQVWLKDAGQSNAFRSRLLMTVNGAEFFGRLVAALPDHYIFPQIAMSALIEEGEQQK